MDNGQTREAVKEKYDIGRILKGLLPNGLYALAGYFSGLAVLPFGASPFGIALLAAADRNAVFVYAGLAVSCLFGFEQTEGITRLGIYTALLLLRVLVRLTLNSPFGKGEKKHSLRELAAQLFREAPAYRYLIAAIAAFSLGFCYLAGGGFLYYDLFGLLLSTATAPIAAYGFSLYFCKKGIARDIGFLALCALCVYGAAEVKLYGVSLAVLGALALTFFVTEKRGMGFGAVTGLALGLVYSPILSPIFVIAAVCAGIFMKISPALAGFSAFAAGAAWGFYIKGIYALDGLFAGLLAACLLYPAARKLFAQSEKRSAEAKKDGICKALGDAELDSVRLFDMNRRMSAIRGGLEELSGIFEEMRLRFPQRGELVKICREAFESSCSGCPCYGECRSRVDIDAEAERLSYMLKSNRGLHSGDMDGELVRRCSRLPDILDEINYNSGARMGGEAGEAIPVPDCKTLSKLLERSMEGESGEYCADKELSQRLCPIIDGLDIGAEGVTVYGKRRRTVYIKAAEAERLESERDRILDALGRSLDFSLDRDSVSIRRCAGDRAGFFVSEGERIRVSYATRQMRARNEARFCGDSLTLFKNGDNRFFALVSDGMGSGREAAEVARICTGFLGGMLKLGGMNEELLSMLNGSLCGRSEGSESECSATVDLMELDLISGSTAFFKSGAAPSYVFRDGSLFKLRSRTMPIGILRDIDAKRFNFELSAGDVVVMMSDGVTGGKEECPWLFDLLRQNVETSGLERTADLILKYAVGHGSEDDISLAVIRVENI